MKKLLLALSIFLIPSLVNAQTGWDYIRIYRASGGGVSLSGTNTWTGRQTFSAGFYLPSNQTFWIGPADGNNNSPILYFNTSQTPDTLYVGPGTIANHIIIAETGDRAFDFAHPTQTNPTLFIHSTNQNTTQWMGLSHDGNYGTISAGSTGILFNNPGSAVIRAEGVSSASLTMGTGSIGFSASLGGGDEIGFKRHASNVLRVFGTTTSTIKGLMGGGAAVASAAALPLPTGRVFHVTGTTNVTSITSTNFESGAVITLIFDGALTFTDGGNLALAGNFVTTASDTITLVYDGTSWHEIARAVN